MHHVHSNPILTAKQMRMAEQHAIHIDKIPDIQLIERAGQAVANTASKYRADAGRIVIIVGTGSNSSDGFVAARLLRLKQVPITVIPLFPLTQLHGNLKYQVELATAAGVKIRPATSHADLPKLQAWLSRAVLVVDAIFGTGLTRPITGWVAEAVQQINDAHCPILAVDIPSGIHADSGEALGIAVRANITLPIAAYKWGHWLQKGKAYRGKILDPAPIGICQSIIHTILKRYPIPTDHSELIDMDMIQVAFPKRPPQSFKHNFGHVWILGGSVGYTGAPKLAALGAQAVSTGLVSIACPNEVYPIVAASSLEVMVHPQEQKPWHNANAIVAGPGWGTTQRDTLITILSHAAPIVLDADALRILAQDTHVQGILSSRDAITVLTPHPGEAAALLDLTSTEVQKDRLNTALALANLYHTWVVLKGEYTLIVSPKKQVWLSPFGSANLATAGTGDILAGMIGGLLASLPPKVAIPAAVGLHGSSGQKMGWFRAGQLDSIIANQVQSFQNKP